MAKKSLMPLALIWIVLILIMGVVAFIGIGSEGFGDGLFSQGKKIRCSADIDDDVFGAIDINDPTSCSVIGTCTQFFSVSQLGFLKEDAEFEIWYNNKEISSNDITVPDSGRIFEIDGCVPEDAMQVKLRVYGKDGGLDDERVVTI